MPAQPTPRDASHPALPPSRKGARRRLDQPQEQAEQKIDRRGQPWQLDPTAPTPPQVQLPNVDKQPSLEASTPAQ